MDEFKYVYGPVPSRRLGISLGVSPIPKKTCNYSCIYCQLGRTTRMINHRQLFYPVDNIIAELKTFFQKNINYDVITIVGEGEPTLYSGLGQLIEKLHKLTNKPIAVITNGSLLYDPDVQSDLMQSDILLPTLDAYDEKSFKKINRPYSSLNYYKVLNGLEDFSRKYKGQLWLEIMFMKGINDDPNTIIKYSEILKKIKYEKLYLNTPVRPPAEIDVSALDHEKMDHIAEILNGFSIDLLSSHGFYSEIKNDYEAFVSIIKRHPMNQFEIEEFLKSRGNSFPEKFMENLETDASLAIIEYKGYRTYRLK
ncbi:MAG TPA: radical SAM protein [Petrotogaceae bacterium]|nr:radical SAM protein [Petrotogaceae bacterium]